jgi:lipopolysaccharide biosynthesis glycosyltransferase
MATYCTIIASNYIPQYLVLKESLISQDKNCELYVLITDVSKEHENLLNFENAYFTEDLDISEKEIKVMRSIYNRTEFATSLKPFLLSKILSTRNEPVMYLDPDILVLNTLEEGFSEAVKAGIALTPHRITPDLNFRINDTNFLKFGVFNLGFIAVDKKATDFLFWWQEKLKWECFNAPELGMYTDQKWINLVPAYFNYSRIAHPGYNIAFWNISERKLTKDLNGIYSNGQPLVFIHFSNLSTRFVNDRYTDLWLSFLDSEIDSETINIVKLLLNKYKKELKLKSDSITNLEQIYKIAINSSPRSLTYRLRIRDNQLNSFRGKSNDSKIGNQNILLSNILNNYFRFLEKFEIIRLVQIGLYLDFLKIRKKIKRY